jgi:hypothetical protein
VRDAFIGSSQPLLAESVAFDHLGASMFWAQLALFEHPDDTSRLFYGIDLSYNIMYSHEGSRSFWAYGDNRATAAELYESLVRSPAIANFLGWDESDVPGAPLRLAGRYTTRDSSGSGPALRVARNGERRATAGSGLAGSEPPPSELVGLPPCPCAVTVLAPPEGGQPEPDPARSRAPGPGFALRSGKCSFSAIERQAGFPPPCCAQTSARGPADERPVGS